VQGWIKLHRQLLASDTFKNEKLLKVWIYCLLKATHRDHEQIVGRQLVRLSPGQFIFGRKKAAECLDMPESTIRDYIKLLEKSQNLTTKTTNKYSVVTLTNWEQFQSIDEIPDSKQASKRTANGQQMDTNKNIKNGKNDKEEKIIYAEFVKMRKQDYETLVQTYGEAMTKRMITELDNYKGAKGKTYKDDYRAILSWVVKKVQESPPLKMPKKEETLSPAARRQAEEIEKDILTRIGGENIGKFPV
jgi:hypothetical protein